MRRRRPGRAQAARIQSKANPPAEVLAKQSREVERLTARFFELKNELVQDAVETMREMGEVLEEGATVLRGQYMRWVEEDLGISRSAANNYRRVLELSRTSPRVFASAKQLGPSKLFRLARVAPRDRNAALKRRLDDKAVADMTDAEFAIATQPYVVRTRVVSGNMKAHGLRMRVQAVIDQLGEALGFPPIDSSDMRQNLVDDLDQLTKAIAKLRKRVSAR